MAFTYTPGPWKWIPLGENPYNELFGSDIDEAGYPVIDYEGLASERHRDADATLLEAAPELYEALKALVNAIGESSPEMSAAEALLARIEASAK